MCVFISLEFPSFLRLIRKSDYNKLVRYSTVIGVFQRLPGEDRRVEPQTRGKLLYTRPASRTVMIETLHPPREGRNVYSTDPRSLHFTERVPVSSSTTSTLVYIEME